MTATPPFPEAALRAVLAGTVAAWARSGDAPSAGDEPRRCYVDTFAGAEWAFGTGVARGAGDEMRATAALRALDERVTTVLIEEDPAHLQRLYAELEDAVGGERLRATRDLGSLAAGEVSLLESAFAAAAGEVARFATGGRAFVFLAPPAARALPWDALRPLAAAADATLLVRLPFSDFEKQSRHDSPVADLPGFVKRIVEGCSAMLGDPKHAWLPAWRAAAAADGVAAAMAGVLKRFGALLADTAPGRIVKPMVLETADGAAAWLFLVTADAAVAMAANAAVRAAGLKDRAAAADPAPAIAETSSLPVETAPPSIAAPQPIETAAVPAEEEPAPKKAKKRSGRAAAPSPDSLRSSPPPPKPTGGGGTAGGSEQKPPAETIAAPTPVKRAPKPVVAEPLDLFGDDPPSLEPELPTLPDPADVAEQIAAAFAGRTVTWQEVLRAFAAVDLTPEVIRKALAVLRRGGRAVYKSLKRDDDAIEFPAEPIPQPARPKPRRTKAPDDAGLFGEGE
ncbi:MAG TPA: hypothetical protein VF092_21325 [Longimicrobium sp.]